MAVERARGECEVPLTDEEITSKYRDCAGIVLPEDKVQQSLELMLNLEQLQHINELMATVAAR